MKLTYVFFGRIAGWEDTGVFDPETLLLQRSDNQMSQFVRFHWIFFKALIRFLSKLLRVKNWT
jgi:hypothetical protein